MRGAQTQASSLRTDVQALIIRELEQLLNTTAIRKVHFADSSVASPVSAHVTHFPRLIVPLKGCHSMELARKGVAQTVRAAAGQAVFIPENAWNKPDWPGSTSVLTILFGKKQIGISLACDNGASEESSGLREVTIGAAYDNLTQSILNALTVYASGEPEPPLDRLLAESLLYSCLRLFQRPPERPLRKAIRTYEAICLYVQENFHTPLTRESVARHFGLAPNHVSRLFRREGLVSFNDYLHMVRVSRAKFMLRQYGVPLKEIAATCGYHDAAHFCRVFKNVCKLTPTEYRAREFQ